MSSLEQAVTAHLESLLAGLIDGERLRKSQIVWWCVLLGRALENSKPVEFAQFSGFEYIQSVDDIRQTARILSKLL